MSVASFSIDQAGLAGGTTDRGRRDGLATGALVTLNHEGGAFTAASFRILSCPSADTTARTSLARTAYNPGGGVCTYTFSPTALAYGSYLIEEIVDGKRKRLVLAVLTPNLGLEIPAWNAQADPDASMAGEDGASAIAASNQNAVTSRYPAGDPRGDFPAMENAFLALDAAAVGGSVIWQWNGVDATQFASPLVPTDALGATFSGSTPSLTVVAGSNGEGNRLKLAVATAAPDAGVVVWPVKLSEGLELPERYIVRYSLIRGGCDADPPTNLYAGVVFYCTGEVVLGSSFGVAFMSPADSSGAAFQAYMTAGAWKNLAGGSPAHAVKPSIVELEIRGQKPIGDQPAAHIQARSSGGGIECGQFFLDNNSYLTNPFGAAWDALTPAELNQFAIVLEQNTGTIENPYVELGFLQILKHPLDL